MPEVEVPLSEALDGTQGTIATTDDSRTELRLLEIKTKIETAAAAVKRLERVLLDGEES